MNTFAFLFALVYANPAQGGTSPNIKGFVISPMFNGTLYKVESEALKCPSGGRVTFAIDNNTKKERPYLFPIIGSDFTAKPKAVFYGTNLVALTPDWKHDTKTYTNADVEGLKEAQFIKQITYTKADAVNTKFSVQVLLPKIPLQKSDSSHFQVKIEYECNGMDSSKAIPVQKVTFMSHASRFIPGLVVAAISATCFVLL